MSPLLQAAEPPSVVAQALSLPASSTEYADQTPLLDSIAQPDQPWLAIRAQNGDEGGGADPSDPTQVVFHVVTEFEWIKLRDQQGDTVAFKVSPFIPVNLGEEKFLFNFEVPIPQFSETPELGSNTGVGDTRLKLFWLIGTDDDFVRAIVPSIDAVAPTGNENEGTGGGAWVVMPNVVFALQPTEQRLHVQTDARLVLLIALPMPLSQPATLQAGKMRAENDFCMGVRQGLF